ncbi:hypothetical protein Trydic_g9568 [Trypoxylus dichotomus]
MDKGELFCELCKIKLLDMKSREAHLVGKKHQLALHNDHINDKRKRCGVFVGGLPNMIPKEDIMKFLSDLGSTTDIYVPETSSFAFVDFKDEKTAQELIRKRNIFFKGKMLTIRSRNGRTAAIDNEHRQPEIDYEGINESLKDLSDFDEQMRTLLLHLQPDQQKQMWEYRLLCEDLQRCLQNVFPGCRVYPFGSTITRLNFRSSDVDVYVDVTQMPNYVKGNSSQYVKKARNALPKYCLFTNLLAIPKAKTPIVKCVHIQTNISCDFNFKNMLGVCNSYLIRHYISLAPNLLWALMVLKYWARYIETKIPTDLIDKSVEIKKIWYQTINEFVVKVLVKVLKFQVNVLKDMPGKEETAENVTAIDGVTFHCKGKYNLWDSRRTVARDLDLSKIPSVLDKEINISDYITDVLCKDITLTKPIVEFYLTLSPCDSPIQMDFTLTNVSSVKDTGENNVASSIIPSTNANEKTEEKENKTDSIIMEIKTDKVIPNEKTDDKLSVKNECLGNSEDSTKEIQTSELKTENDTLQVSDMIEDNDMSNQTENVKSLELQEEDVPESFFDDLMSEDFIEGLNVVDTWEGDEPNQNSTADNSKTLISKSSPLLISNNDKQENKSRSSNEKSSEKHRKRSKQDKDKPKHIRTTVKDKESKQNSTGNNSKALILKTDPLAISNNDKQRTSNEMSSEKHRKRLKQGKDKSKRMRSTSIGKGRKRSRSRSKSYKIMDSNSRRDPSKTQRDILRDKDKCEKDKTAKILHEKLKVVETGLVPPGMEMEVDMQHSESSNKLEEGELLPEEDEIDIAKKLKSKSMERKQIITETRLNSERKRDIRHSKVEHPKHSPSRHKRDVSLEYRRERRIRSRSRSPRRRSPPYIRSRSIERRIERRRRSPRRTRSRSFDRHSLGKEKKYKYMSPSRRTSPISRRTENLFRELDLLKSRLFLNDPLRSPPSKNLQEQHCQNSNMNIPQSYMDNSHQFPPAVNQNYVPLQPVPPPQHTPVELDQQFFIGQPTFEPSYAVPIQQQPPLMQESGMPLSLDGQHNFHQDWHANQSMNFFVPDNQFNSQQNNFQSLTGPPMGFTEQFTFPIQNPGVRPPAVSKQYEEEIFIKLFEDNKITLSDYLTLSAKSTDNSHPFDIQNKIKVISHCQEALSEINEASKTLGKFLLRKSQKSIKPSSTEGLSPFKKVPAIKFQFTTCSKQVDDKLHLSSSLNRLLRRLGKEALFQETHAPLVPAPNSKYTEHKESPKTVKRTSNASTQTDPPSASDFGCQVTFEELPSPTKNIFKQQSIAKLTPAQLLAQAETEASPPPAPRWSPSVEKGMIRRNDVCRDLNDMDRRNIRGPGFNMRPNHSRNVPNNIPLYNRPPDDLNHHYYGNFHQHF